LSDLLKEDLVKLLKRLSDKMNEIDERLARLESSNIVFEERMVPTKRGEFEGKTYFRTEEGGIVKESRIPLCDVCGRRGGEFNVCVGCCKKLCKECEIVFQGKIYCSECLEEIMWLSKGEFKVLLAIWKNVPLELLKELARMRSDEVEACVESLLEKGLIELRGFLFFKEFRVLDRGLEAISAYKRVYSKEEDVLLFMGEIGYVC